MKTSHLNFQQLTTLVSLVALIGGAQFSRAKEIKRDRPVRVLNPKRMAAANIAAVRTPLGIPNDYKPWLTRLGGDKLLMVAFSYGGVPHNKLPKGKPYLERAIFWRSNDGGKTWGAREEHPEVHGREFSLNRLNDGTLMMPCHFLKQDAANKAGYTYSKLFRSTDDGKTWTETRIGPKGFPPRANTATDWSVLEVPDPKAPGRRMAVFGVSMQHGGKRAPSVVAMWRSRDSGKTWNKTMRPNTDGWIDVDGFFSQSTTYRARSGKLLHVIRVDATGPHWAVPDLKSAGKENGDQADRMMLWTSANNGARWRRQGRFGTFGAGGEMYPRFLRLPGNRLLLTFTVRSSTTDGNALGLRAIVSPDDGATWDFDHDRLVIDDQNIGASGGGFGNTIRANDGALVSTYSYRGKDGQTHIETARWHLPAAKK